MRARILQIFLIFFIFPVGMVHAQDVGRVLLAAGEVTAARGTATIKLTPGALIQDKDILRTGATSNLQVRFVDDSLVSLRENSELRIEEFRFSGKEDGSERGFFNLVKGGLRAFTGLVGRSNNSNYRMTTNTAVIGIRGTDYVATLCEQGSCRNTDGSAAKDGLYGRVLGASHGTNRVDVKNDRDQREFGINENFYVADNKSLIEPLLAPPDFLSGKLEGRSLGGTAVAGRAGTDQNETNGTQQDSRISKVPLLATGLTFVAPETGSMDSTPYTLPVLTSLHSSSSTSTTTSPLAPPPPFGLVGAWSSSISPFTFTTTGALVTSAMLTLNGLSDVTGVNIPSGTETFPSNSVISGAASGAPLNTGGDPAVNANWGRWPSGSVITANSVSSTTSGGAHFLYGDNAPADVIAAKTGSFALIPIGGTTQTDRFGTPGTGSYPGITLDFTARTGSVGAFTWTFSSDPWIMLATTNGQITIVPGKGAAFAASGTGSCLGTGCGSGFATYGVNGVFLGAQGNYLGVAIGMQMNSGASSAQGVQLYRCSTAC